ncbi:Choline/Carnitine o-acyltransferase-domain-containing protein [Tirmania nivea]|nr:Choline/Carnitine o-acyltransferase-domain-containing protein [Tirmania nivea]
MPKSLDESLSRQKPEVSPQSPKGLGHGKKHTSITYAHQSALQKLPIPDLLDTCRKYLDAVRPLHTPREHGETVAAVKEFLKTDGPDLQERLKRYAATKASYIEQFWYDSYLHYDNPVVLNLNPFFLLEDDPTPARNNQVTRAASLVVSSCAFVRALRKEELPPDKVRGTPLCMYQYPRIVSTARIPTTDGCVMQSDHTSKHIVVICRSQFYWFDVLDENSDVILIEKDVAHNLQAVVEDAQNTPILEAAKSAMGVLTTENRRVWASLREVLTRDGPNSNNSECLRIIDTALFILCLDSVSPTTGSEMSMNMLCGTNVVEKGVQIGTCTNRWYDKLQIIVCENGSAGINFEHTGVDGHTVLRMASDVYTDTILRFARTINGNAPSLWASTSPDPSKRDPASFGNVNTVPHRLEWTMLPELSTALRFAETRLADLIQQNEFQVLEFAGYGKNFITSMGFSPDAFVQMAFQAAYYGLYGRVESTYEPAMTKMFLHGRTEAIRTVSDASVEFVRKFCEDVPATTKIDALRKACERHVAITKECAKGLGQDRHLYALFCIWQRQLDEETTGGAKRDVGFSNGSGQFDGYSSNGDMDDIVGSPSGRSTYSDEGSIAGSSGYKQVPSAHTPAIFQDAAWNKLNTTILSTSNCGNPSLRLFGFGPTSADGFGLGYIIKDDSISICCSSKHRQTKRFMDTLQNYFIEIRHLLRQTQRRQASPSTTRAREAHSERKGYSLPIAGGVKPRSGRAVSSVVTNMSGASDSSNGDSDGEGGMVGGYGYFDAGKSLGHLLSSGKHHEKMELEKKNPRRAIGRAIRLAEY